MQAADKMALNGGVKRIPKRSVVGSPVCVLSEDGMWRQGTVVGMRSNENRLIPIEKKFCVELAEGPVGSSSHYYRDTEMVGPGFLTTLPLNTRLRPGQEVYMTHSGREVRGTVEEHDEFEDCVSVLVEGVGTLYKRLEDVRLMESRKSARLVNSDTDFARLSDLNIAQQRKQLLKEGQSRRRLHSMSSFTDRKLEMERLEARRIRRGSEKGAKSGTRSIDMPLSRKRRTSESRSDMESGYGSSYGSSLLRSGDDVRECTAAMVLMNLSVSPSERWRQHSLHSSPSFYSDSSTPQTPKPSPSNSLSNLLSDGDEEPTKRQKASRVVFECTWRGCQHSDNNQESIERHVRGHLGRPEPAPGEDRDFEEEFYYTEVDMEVGELTPLEIMEADVILDTSTPDSVLQDEYPPCKQRCPSESIRILGPVRRQEDPTPTILAYSAPSHVTAWNYRHPAASAAISEHLDMAKPAQLYLLDQQQAGAGGRLYSGFPPNRKLVSIIPRPEAPAPAHQQQPFLFTAAAGGQQLAQRLASRSDRKCRKVYGIEQKDLWCTQCKWKKACARFA